MNFTATYARDYFYVCPGKATNCRDREKVLYFSTDTIYWPARTRPGRLSTEERKYILEVSGAGFYRFGPLSAKQNEDPGCRVWFAAPGSKVNPKYDCPFIAPVRSKSVQVSHALLQYDPYATKGVKIATNPNILWGIGSRFSSVFVAHGFVDPDSPPNKYVYFIGTGELTSKIIALLPNFKIIIYRPTGKIYLARLPASEWALQNAQFEYYTGLRRDVSCWGTYDQSQPIYTDPQQKNPALQELDWHFQPSSFTERSGRYYIAADCSIVLSDVKTNKKNRHRGMCVIWSDDGFNWKDKDFDLVEYSRGEVIDSEGHDNGPAANVYGHSWVPENVNSTTGYIPYIFSVWKSLYGYTDDFWFSESDSQKSPIAPKYRFPSYNLKMYLYKPKT
jgi:hypothetical protein